MSKVAPPPPNLVLAGVGKAGTSSLFWYLSQHPQVCPSRVKEPRYFLPVSETEEAATGELPDMAPYLRLFDQWSGEPYRMEATPHYFHGGERLVQAMLQTLPNPRVILTLRDPVQRAWSIYRFAQSMFHIPTTLSFEEFLSESEAVYAGRRVQSQATRPYWTSISGSMYSEFMPPWLDGFDADSLRIVFFEEIVQDPAGLVRRLADWLDVDSECVSRFSFSAENRSVLYRRRWLQQVALALNSERLLGNRRVVKRPLRALYRRINGAPGATAMPSDLERRLVEIFRPSNAELYRQLSHRGYKDIPSWLSGAGDA